MLAAADVALAAGDFALIAKIVQDHLAAAAVSAGVLDDQLELGAGVFLELADTGHIGVLLILADVFDEEFLDVAVLEGEEHGAAGGQAVAAGTAGLLVIGFE